MIQALISDFDGTLVDTFEANFLAYQEAFRGVGHELTRERYKECFGYRFDRFMKEMSIADIATAAKIRELKKVAYPNFFSHLIPNKPLIDFISAFKASGGKTAIASTARRENLMNALNHLGIAGCFDLIYSAEDVKEGKPAPEIYLNTMERLKVTPEETLIFEDSPVGIEAAKKSGAQYIQISEIWFIQ